MKIKASVLIPAYNAEKTIKRAIDSIPDREDIEILVWDDGSEDFTYEQAQEALHGRKNPRLVGISVDNHGVAATLNLLLARAKGEFVTFLGSDDWLITDAFEKIIDNLKPNQDLVYYDLEINSGEVFHLTEETKNLYCGSTKFMRREFIKELWIDETKKAAEDRYFFEELQKRNPRETFTGVVAKHYNFPREGSLTWKRQHGMFRKEEI